MTVANRYSIDSIVTVSVQFTLAADNSPADPDQVSVYVQTPHGVATRYDYGTDPIERDGVGLYHYDVLADASGIWLYKWQGSGAVQVTSNDIRFLVDTSEVIVG
jgi:hypothetical protein